MGVDVLVALVPYVLADQRVRQPLGLEQPSVDPDHQDLLVVGAVEDPDPPALRARLVGPPEVVVVELLGARRLEGAHVAALRIDPGHDVLDRAVLARRVHALEDQQERPPVLGVERLLHVAQQLGASRQKLERVGLRLDPARVARIHVLEPELVALPHVVSPGQARQLLEGLARLHRPGSLVRKANACLRGARRLFLATP